MRSLPLTVAALVAANLVPLAGVAFLDWRLLDVMLIYWLENGVIGAYNLLRMATVGTGMASAALFAPFFAVHYGMFWIVHGVFVVAIFGEGGFAASFAGPAVATPSPPAGGASPSLPLVGAVHLSEGAAWALASLVASHGASYVRTWWRDGERLRVTPAQLMKRPYVRVTLLHVTLLAGGFAAQALGRPAVALVAMVVLKVGVDVAAHLREHRSAAPPDPAAARLSSARAR